MELLDMPATEVPESETVLSLEDLEFDRIAFELWQRSSLPELAEATQAELEEVACHASCL
jgi:hypothetical protein